MKEKKCRLYARTSTSYGAASFSFILCFSASSQRPERGPGKYAASRIHGAAVTRGHDAGAPLSDAMPFENPLTLHRESER